jgi:hypothetical protein
MYFLIFIYKDGKIHGRRETRLTPLKPPIWRKENYIDEENKEREMTRKHDITWIKKKVRSNHNNKGDIMWKKEKKRMKETRERITKWTNVRTGP